MEDKKVTPETYYSLHAEELKLLQFLLYHLKNKQERKKPRGFTVENGKHTIDFK